MKFPVVHANEINCVSYIRDIVYKVIFLHTFGIYALMYSCIRVHLHIHIYYVITICVLWHFFEFIISNNILRNDLSRFNNRFARRVAAILNFIPSARAAMRVFRFKRTSHSRRWIYSKDFCGFFLYHILTKR